MNEVRSEKGNQLATMAALARSSFQAFGLDSKSICSGFNLSLDSNSICSGFKHSPRRVKMAPISLPSHNRTCSETRCCSRESNNLALFESSRRKAVMTMLMGTVSFVPCDEGRSVSTSKRALRSQKIPESEFTTLSNGLKYYDLKVGSGPEAVKGSRVALHYVVKWKGVTFMTSRQGMGVTGGTPYGFDVGASENGSVLKGLDLGVQGMRVGGQRLLIVPPELAYGNKGIQEIPPNATLEFDLELLSIKQSPFGSSVKLVEG